MSIKVFTVFGENETNVPNLSPDTLDQNYSKEDQEKSFGVRGSQVLSLSLYQNCEFNSLKEEIKIRTPVTFVDCVFKCPLVLELPANFDDENFVTTKGTVTFTGESTLKVVENAPYKKSSYPQKTLILNNGCLSIETRPKISCNRMLTFISNNSYMTVPVPNIEFQGGDLFKGTSTSKNLIKGNDDSTSIVEVHRGNSTWMYMNAKVVNRFSLGCFDSSVIFQDVKINLKVPDPGIEKPNLFITPGDSSKDALAATRLLTIQSSSIWSNYPVNLASGYEILKVNSTLDNVYLDKAGSHIKKITNDYILDDTDMNMFHIEPSREQNNIDVAIPDELSIGERILFFKMLGNHHTNKVVVRAKNLEVQLNRSKSQVEIYKYEDVWYSKNYC